MCSWDSSIHDSVHLNRITSSNERIYLIIKATVQLSHPASMELVLRKRIAVNIYNKQVKTSGMSANPRGRSAHDGGDFTKMECGVMINGLDLVVAEFHSEPEAKDVLKEHTVFVRCDLRDRFQHTKGYDSVHRSPTVRRTTSLALSFINPSRSSSSRPRRNQKKGKPWPSWLLAGTVRRLRMEKPT